MEEEKTTHDFELWFENEKLMRQLRRAHLKELNRIAEKQLQGYLLASKIVFPLFAAGILLLALSSLV